MTMHSVFLKEHEGIPHNYTGAVPRWCGVGAQSPLAVTVYGDAFSQSKPAALEVSAAGSLFTVTKQPEDGHQGLGKGNTTDLFIRFSDDCKTAGNGAKTQLQTVTSIQPMEYPGQLELGFGQPQICAKYPYAEQCHGLYSNYGTQIAGRVMLPLSMTTDGGPIFVNPKQYNGILRRRKLRARAEMENKVPKLRKPYQHLSRHLHAMRRARGSGGRFLNTKSSNESNEKNGEKKIDKEEKHLPQSTESRVSEMLQSVVAINSRETNSSGRSTSPGSEVISHLFSRASTVQPFHFNHLHPSYPNLAKTGLGIAMAAGNYLKVG